MTILPSNDCPCSDTSSFTAEINEDDKRKTSINIFNTNARSLCPKISSLIDCYEELDITFGIVTETWLNDGPTLEEDLIDLEHGSGLGSIVLNRPPGPTGSSHGG